MSRHLGSFDLRSGKCQLRQNRVCHHAIQLFADNRFEESGLAVGFGVVGSVNQQSIVGSRVPFVYGSVLEIVCREVASRSFR